MTAPSGRIADGPDRRGNYPAHVWPLRQHGFGTVNLAANLMLSRNVATTNDCAASVVMPGRRHVFWWYFGTSQ